MANIQEKDKILEVKNLRISFKTNSGTVKAVRGIDFSLRRGKTLAIVGESGSGKSVTSKAILGILANNKIVEDGQIIYDGKDLLKVTEEQFTKIRGVKISMIFQDPLSSLNPIMKVGKQLTEAMYLKHKASVKEAKKNLARINKILLFSNQSIGEAHSFVDNLKKLNKEDNVNDFVSSQRELFVNALTSSLLEREKSIGETLILIDEYKNNCFVSFDSFDIGKARNDIKKVVASLNKCILPLQINSDDIIEVFDSSINFYFDSIDDSIKQLKQRNELLVKYNANSVFDLPAEIRAKNREVITDSEVHYNAIIKLIDNLVEHLNELSKEKISDEMVDSLIEFYVKQVVESKAILTHEQTRERAIELMREVGINEPERRFNQYPFEFSGGMRQRIVIAIALSSNPEVLICDEPTTALDVTIQAQILELINKLKEEKNLSIIFITHDLGVVANMADDIAVMYAGKIVEYGSVYDIFYDPRHPYTWALLSSMPDLNTSEKLDAIPGTPPNMLLPPKGDAFAARNKYALEIDYEEQPPFFEISPSHYAATWLCDEYAPDVEAPQIVKERIYNSLKSNNDNKPSYVNKKNSILNKMGGKK